MLFKSIIVLAVLLVRSNAKLNCYECKESQKYPNKTTGGPCYKPDSTTNLYDKEDCLYCSTEILEIKLNGNSYDLIKRECYKNSDANYINGKCLAYSNSETKKVDKLCVCSSDKCLPENNPLCTEKSQKSDSSSHLLSWAPFITSLILSAKLAV